MWRTVTAASQTAAHEEIDAMMGGAVAVAMRFGNDMNAQAGPPAGDLTRLTRIRNNENRAELALGLPPVVMY
jgi:hypothetical protein